MLVTHTGLLCQFDIYVYIHTHCLSDAWMNVCEACIGHESSNCSTVQINRERKNVSDDIYKEVKCERR